MHGRNREHRMKALDAKPRPLANAILNGVVSGIVRTVLDWIITLVTH